MTSAAEPYARPRYPTKVLSDGGIVPDRSAGPIQPLISATPYAWKDPASIPPRQFLHGGHLIRGFASGTIAPGGVGKTGLKLAQALEMASGKSLLGGQQARRRLRAWLWNLEDPAEELDRRIQAAALYYELGRDDIAGWLFVDSGRDQPCVIAKTTKSGAVILEPVIENIVAEIRSKPVDVLIIDPFVSSHEVAENDNAAIDMVAKAWGRVAHLGSCAVELVHHTRKANGEQETTMQDARGASALADACRSVAVLNRMTKAEAEKAGIENPRLYFRLMVDKGNMAPPADKSDWFKLESVSLGNASDDWPDDQVAVVTSWQWPNPMESVQVGHLREVQARIAAGKYRESSQANDWAGNVVADVMRFDLAAKGARPKVAGILKTWIANRMLKVVDEPDPKTRKRVKFIEVDQSALD